jgi:hypothetical protein
MVSASKAIPLSIPTQPLSITLSIPWRILRRRARLHRFACRRRYLQTMSRLQRRIQ